MNCFSVLAFLLAAGNIWTDVSQASMMCFLLLSRSLSIILNAECIVHFWHQLIADHFS